jgi:hypothetical protein
MEIILILIGLFLLVAIYGITIGLLFTVLGIGLIVGFPAGIIYGIKNYMSSILDNIENKAFKTIMMIITSLIIVLVLFYLVAIIYYTYNYNI